MDDKKEIKKKKTLKNLDPSKYIDTEPTMNEAVKSSIVISFGRFNPITVGHEKLVSKVISEAAKRKADAAIYMSHSQDSKKNPLSYIQKTQLGQKAFGKIVKKSNARSIIEVAKELSNKYDNLIVVVGSDRVSEFQSLLSKYNEMEYVFKNIEVVSAGERDPDAEGVTGMSASKMRELAKNGDAQSFKSGLPTKLKSSAVEIINMVRKGMGINDELKEENLLEQEPLSLQQRRKRALIMRRYKSKIKVARERAKRKMAPKEKLLKRSRKMSLNFIRNRLSKNKKYSEMSPAEKIALDKRLMRVPKKVIDRIAKRLLPKVRQAEKERLTSVLSPKTELYDINNVFEVFMESRTTEPQDPDVKDMPGSQPKAYYKGLEKDVKDARARHFAKYAKKSDDDPASYKKAPGDEGAETKPSVHTKKFKQMFGESLQEASLADTRVRSRPHMALEKNSSVKFDKRFKMYRSKQEINESVEDINEDLANLIMDIDSFIMSEEFDTLMESNPTEALKNKAEKTGISYGILKKVFDRGVAAWRTGHRPGTTPTQWGLARVNSFATKGKGTWGKADSDLAARVRKEEYTTEGAETAKAKMKIASEKSSDARKHDRMLDTAKERDKAAKKSLTRSISEGNPNPSKREDGTDSLVNTYKSDTPGQKKKLKEFTLTNSYGSFRRGDRVRFSNHSMDMFDENEHEGTVVGGDVSWLRVRDDAGMLFKVRHYNANPINETTTLGFEGKKIKVKNVPVRMADGTIKSLPPSKSASSSNGNGE
jgi:nicotinic acid mononucleotide adenylyltransferase